jgi:hypothetical protein
MIGLPTDRTMEMSGCKTYKTYKKALDDLIKWDKIKLVSKSYNDHTCNQVTLVINTKVKSKTDKFTLVKNTKAEPKQPPLLREKLPKVNHHNKTGKDSFKTNKECNAHPSLEEIESIIKEKSLTATNALAFFNHYVSVDWKTSGPPIVNWEARLIKWNEDNKDKNNKHPQQVEPIRNEIDEYTI